MKTLKTIILILLILIAIPFIIALFIDKDYSVEREVVINQPKLEVFDYVKCLKNQEEYSKWAMMDPQMTRTFTGEDASVGFISAWESDVKEVGAGEQEIIDIKDGERIDYELRFFKPFESTEKAYMTTEAVNDNQTKVVWGFNGHMDYPSNLMLLFMDFEKMLGDDLQEGLNNLKDKLEE